MTTTRPQILVAFDFSESSELALQHSLNLSFDGPERDFHFIVAIDARKGLGLRPKEVVDFKYTEEIQALATEYITNAIAKLDRGGEVSMIVHVRIGDPVAVILEIAEEIGASLVLLGSHGRRGLALLMGSTANGVMHGSSCDVLAVRVGK